MCYQSPHTPLSINTELSQVLESQERELESRRSSMITMEVLLAELNAERTAKNEEIQRLKVRSHTQRNKVHSQEWKPLPWATVLLNLGQIISPCWFRDLVTLTTQKYPSDPWQGTKGSNTQYGSADVLQLFPWTVEGFLIRWSGSVSLCL